MFKILHIPTAACTKFMKYKFNVKNLLHNYKYFMIDGGAIKFYNRNTEYNLRKVKEHLHEFEIVEVDDV